MRKIFKMLVCVSFILIFSVSTIYAEPQERVINVETQQLSNGDIIEVIITESEPQAITRATKIKSGSKTVNYKNSSGDIMWYAKETGTFSYTGGTAECIGDSIDAASYESTWKITSRSSSRRGNTAIGKVTAKHYFLGNIVDTINETINVSCSATGEIY